MSVDWGQVNALLIVALMGYIWHQSRTVDSVKQALLGFEGKGGVIDEIKGLRARTHDLTSAMSALSVNVGELNKRLDVIAEREDSK